MLSLRKLLITNSITFLFAHQFYIGFVLFVLNMVLSDIDAHGNVTRLEKTSLTGSCMLRRIYTWRFHLVSTYVACERLSVMQRQARLLEIFYPPPPKIEI